LVPAKGGDALKLGR